MPPLVIPVFLELPGLDGNLPLPLHLRADGGRLPGLHVRGRLPPPAAGDPAADPGSGAAALPQGETAPTGKSVASVVLSKEPWRHINEGSRVRGQGVSLLHFCYVFIILCYLLALYIRGGHTKALD